MVNKTPRFTRRCLHGTYRVPIISNNEIYVLESNDNNTIRKQQNSKLPNAYFGDAINLLGRYEELGYTPEELKHLIDKIGD